LNKLQLVCKEKQQQYLAVWHSFIPSCVAFPWQAWDFRSYGLFWGWSWPAAHQPQCPTKRTSYVLEKQSSSVGWFSNSSNQ